MKPVETVVAAAIGVAVVTVLAAAAVPGAFAGPAGDEPARPGTVDVEEVPITPGDVTGETATLGIEARLDHRGDPSDNVTVLFRATDSESSLLETARTVDVGTLSGSRETPVTANLTVEREGGYEIETIVFQDGQRVDESRRQVSGLEALTPAYARSNVVFAETGALQPVSVAVGSAADEQVSLDLSAALTNEGDEPAGDLAVTFTARQADSNIVADRVTVPVEAVRAGRTATVEAAVTVPDEYNYYVDTVLWRDSVHVDSAQSAANLDPTEQISADETESDVQFEASEFESESGFNEDGAMSASDDGAAAESSTAGETPGFGVLVAIAGLLATALVARRRSR